MERTKAKKLALRLAFYIAGSLLTGFATALFNYNALGSSAMNTLFSAVAARLGILPGYVYTAFNGTFLLVGFLLARKYMGFGSVLMIFAQGPLLNFFTVLLAGREQLFAPLAGKAAAALVSFALYSFGMALAVCACFGIPGYEACLFMLGDKLRFPYKYIKIASELLYFVAAYFLGGVYGVMTLVMVFCYGPALSFFVVRLNGGVFRRLGVDNEKNELGRNRRSRHAQKGADIKA